MCRDLDSLISCRKEILNERVVGMGVEEWRWDGFVNKLRAEARSTVALLGGVAICTIYSYSPNGTPNMSE
jgi:hypothetical protein